MNIDTSNDKQAGGLRAYIVGRSILTNEGLADWLSTVEGISVAGMETSIVKASLVVEKLMPEVVLMDFEMDALLCAVPMFKRIRPTPVVIVLAQKPTPVIRRICLELGAQAIFDKTSEFDLLFEFLQTLLPGWNAPIPPETPA